MFLGLRRKIVLTYTLCFVILIVITAFYFFYYVNIVLLNENKQSLKENAGLIRTMIQERFQPPYGPELDRFVGELAKNSRFRISVIDGSGKLVADSGISGSQLGSAENHRERPEVLQAESRGEGWGRRLSVTTHKEHIYYAVLLSPKGPRAPILRLALYYQIYEKVWTHFVKGSLFVLLGIGIISLIAAFLISRKIVDPIREMVRVAGQFSRQDFKEKIYIHSKDEIGRLSGKLNEMAEELESQLKELAREKGQLEAILANMTEGVLVTNRSREIVLMNPSFKVLFQTQFPEKLKTVLEHLRNIPVEEALKEAIQGGREIRREMTLDRKPTLILEMAASPLMVGGVIEGVVAVFHNITAIRRAENEMRDFIQNASHELRTPLTVIKGYLENLLEDSLADKQTVKEQLQIISNSANRLEYLISDILDLSKIEGGKIKIEKTALQVHDEVQRILNDFRKNLSEKKVALINSIPKGMPPVLMGGLHFSQVLGNLIDNAVKYSGENTSVTINASPGEDPGFISISVKDQGIGIPEADLSRIFERFYRVDKDRSRNSGGTGLGLSIVRFLIEAYGGTVHVESKVGVGSTFSFTLPTA